MPEYFERAGDLHAVRHSHECRRCGSEIPCDYDDGPNGCRRWNGDNDGCPDLTCAPHSADCHNGDGYRCVDCY